jgi:hypothetical protein
LELLALRGLRPAGDLLGEMLGDLQCRQQLGEDQHFVTAH